MKTPLAPLNPLMRHYARSRAWCEWEAFEQWQPRMLGALAHAGGPAVSPFQLLSLPGISAHQQHDCAVQWMRARLLASMAARADMAHEFAAQAASALPRAAGRAIRLGYLSGDFHMHATALLLAETLEAHDRQRFELHAYSYGPDDGSAMRQRLHAAFDGFHEISALDDAQAARAIHADGIDILIDLKGFTAGTRSLLLAYRPAPVQVNYLGYPGTLGGNFCDYLVSDRFITPTSAVADYSEALACLPHSYQPHGHAAVLPPTPSRAQAGLPDEGLVLCCFNQSYKFTPEVFGVWCDVLAQVPGSVLWLLKDERAEGNLRREAMARGVAPHRLVFAPDLPQAGHLARLQCADLVLDTSPYNAHTTASDALWAGVPLVTRAGSTFASRVAGSLLHAVGLPELVTHSLDDYAALALALATAPQRLAALRAKLAGLRAGAALFDVPGYTRDLEALYTAMWGRHVAGLAPQGLDLPQRPA
jgi:predicted O-linked N-acetylglucosamine transferase (SPINDLY family)